MKLSAYFALFAILFHTACSKSDPTTDVADHCYNVSFAVADTRVDYAVGSNGSIGLEWLDGDVIYVATSDGTWGSGYREETKKPKIFTYDAASGLFVGDATIAGGTYTFRAQYAVENQRTYVLAKSASNKLLASQSQSETGMSHLKTYDCMVAQTTATISDDAVPTFAMKHLYSFIRISIKNETASPQTLTSVAFRVPDKALNGIFTITDLSAATTSPKSGNSDTATLVLDNIAVQPDEAFDAYLVVAPFADFSGVIEIEVATAAERYRIEKEMTSFTVERSKLYTTSVALNSSTQVGGSGGGSGDTSGPAIEGRTGWAELPAYKEGADLIYHFHSALKGSATERNYSFCFDKGKRASYWVAYPLHTSHISGSANRDNSSFGFDPDVKSSWQANLANSYVGAYDRGHQLPAADRKCSQDMMDQTFYSTNMTPQSSNFNQKLWAALESTVRTYACADTLYVVTGAYFGDVWDSSIASSTTDRDGAVCPTPTHYYKVLLRTKAGNTGKSVRNCLASELKCVGYWLTHENNSSTSVPSSALCSVADIEQKTGFTFFVNVPNAPKDTFSSSEW